MLLSFPNKKQHLELSRCKAIIWINPGHLPDRSLFWVVPDVRPHLDRLPQSWNSFTLKAFILALDFLHNFMENGRFWLQMGLGALPGGDSEQIYLDVGWVCFVWKYLDEPPHPNRRMESSRSSPSSKQMLLFQIEGHI